MESSTVVIKREVLLAVTGGIAAYKSAALASLLVQRGYSLTVMMTEAATKFVQPATFAALSGREVLTSLWDSSLTIPHIHLAKKAHFLVVAPASADMMAKVAHGIADCPVSATILAFPGPILMAPAMNTVMWMKPATQRNFHQLQSDGIHFVGPVGGRLGCGDTGVGRMVEPEEILHALEALEDSVDH